MKLLIVTAYYWPAFIYGGPVFSLHYLNKALVPRGIDITVYTTNVNLDKKVAVNQETDVDGVKVIYFSFARLFEFVAPFGWQFSLPMRKAFRENLKNFDLAYISSIWSYPTVAAAYYCRKFRKPYILAPRGMLYPQVLSKKIWKKWPYYQLVQQKALKGASAIHYTAEDEAQKTHPFLRLNNPQIIIPNGIDLSEFSDIPDRDRLRSRYPHLKNKKIILFLGRINWKKGLDILIKAYAQLTKDRSDTHLLIAGQDEKGYSSKVKKWIKDYKMDDAVTFTGMLTGREKIEAYAGSDIFVLPSYSENFGMAVVEAFACGLPVIISNNVGIYKEVESNKAGIIIRADAQELYEGMKRLLDDASLRNELIKNGKRLAEEYYNIDKVADKMIKAFNGILKRLNRMNA